MWISALKKGDQAAFINIYNEFWESLYAISYNRVRSKEVAEDILQEVFTNLWKTREILNIKTSLRNYLYTAIKYKVRSLQEATGI